MYDVFVPVAERDVVSGMGPFASRRLSMRRRGLLRFGWAPGGRDAGGESTESVRASRRSAWWRCRMAKRVGDPGDDAAGGDRTALTMSMTDRLWVAVGFPLLGLVLAVVLPPLARWALDRHSGLPAARRPARRARCQGSRAEEAGGPPGGTVARRHRHVRVRGAGGRDAAVLAPARTLVRIGLPGVVDHLGAIDVACRGDPGPATGIGGLRIGFLGSSAIIASGRGGPVSASPRGNATLRARRA